MIVDEMAYKVSIQYDSFLTGKKKVEDGLKDIENAFNEQSKSADNASTKTSRSVSRSSKSIQDSNRKSTLSYLLLTKSVTGLGDAGRRSFKIASTGAATFLGVALSLEGARRMFVSTTDQLVKLGNNADFLGMSARSLDGFSKAAEQAGASGQEVTNIMMGIKDAQLRMRTGIGGASPIMGILQQISTAGGVDILGQKDPGSALNAMARDLRAMPKSQSQAYANMAGISPAMYEAIMSKNWEQNVAKLTNTSGATDQEIKQARDVNAVMVELKQTVEGLGDDMVRAFGPQVVTALQKIDDWVTKNKGGIIGFFNDASSAADKVAASVGGISNLLKIYAGWRIGGIAGAAAAAGGVGAEAGWDSMMNNRNNAYGSATTAGGNLKKNSPLGRAWDWAANSDIWGDVSSFFVGNAKAGEVTPSIPGVTSGVNQNRLMDALMMTESGGNPLAYNTSSGAAGAYQFMPATARQFGLHVGSDYDDRLNPEKARAAATMKMAGLIRHYRGNITQALQAYNWGEGNMDAWLRTGRGIRGQAMPQETIDYAGKVAKYYGGMANSAMPVMGRYGSTDNSQSSTTNIQNVTVNSNPQTIDQLTSSIEQQASRGKVTVTFAGGNHG